MGNKKKRGLLHRLKGSVRPHRTSRNKKKKKREESTKLYRVLDDLFVAAIRKTDAATLEPIIEKLSPKTICRLKKTTIMGLYRLFRREGRRETIERIITTYLASPKHTHLKLYFLEPLAELDCAKVLRDASLVEFAASHRPPSSLQVLKTLSTEYEPADEADHRNFERLILEPLRVITQQPNNLMDIRFSPEQRRALQTKIRSSLIDGRPLSLLRLGDGEAYPFPVPEVEGIPTSVFQDDDLVFEKYLWRTSNPKDAREVLRDDFRMAVSRCDILGIPSVYRIIRNLTHPHSRYGNRRNQRAFLRILGSVLGMTTSATTFTEERCTRVRGAIDAPFLLELAAKAGSLVLVSCWPEIQSKFPVQATFVPVTQNKFVLFKTYADICERLAELSGPGTLVLIGAGVPAKIMADRARKAGAVALDVGSLIDYMVGLKTRTVSDLV